MIEKYLNTAFALEPRFHSVQSGLIMRRLARGEKALDLAEQMKERQAPYETGPMAGFWDENGSYHAFGKAMAKGGQTVAVIPIMGVMTRYGDMCSYGSEDIASWIMEANAMESVVAIVLEINSPGGQVDGTELLGEVVRQSQKPVVAFVAGMAAVFISRLGSLLGLKRGSFDEASRYLSVIRGAFCAPGTARAAVWFSVTVSWALAWLAVSSVNILAIQKMTPRIMISPPISIGYWYCFGDIRRTLPPGFSMGCSWGCGCCSILGRENG